MNFTLKLAYLYKLADLFNYMHIIIVVIYCGIIVVFCGLKKEEN